MVLKKLSSTENLGRTYEETQRSGPARGASRMFPHVNGIAQVMGYVGHQQEVSAPTGVTASSVDIILIVTLGNTHFAQAGCRCSLSRFLIGLVPSVCFFPQGDVSQIGSVLYILVFCAFNMHEALAT